ncbi:MAG: GT4 family glycosyltransferase PelF [Clostridia bacterium]|nr:GT4 family glycosyltransferase PelF [Clostridia bacterium]
MKICLILEGCYPFINGGVSTWMHQYITEMPEHEFVLWVIGAKAEDRDKFVYTLPKNVVAVQQVFLDDALRVKDSGVFPHVFTEQEKEAHKRLVASDKPDWDLLFDLYQVQKINPMAYLKSQSFLETLTETCEEEFPFIAFSDAFHSVRSRLLPVLYLMGTEIPKADCYHAICTGYGGLLASMAAHLRNKPLLLTEHGIYTREREEEIIRAKWVARAFKPHWVSFFYMLSDLIYSRAFRVTSLFTRAMYTQIDMGCAPEKCRVVENGISYERLCDIPLKEEDGIVDIGAVVRLAPIKDIKTMIYAFFELSCRKDNVRLHIMGGVDDQEYADECYALVKQLNLEDKIIFTGRVNIIEYFEKLDFTLLTSISEGQPLSVLESFAARRPCVTTDVGCCSELLNGKPGDTLGKAGFFVPPMQRDKLADAMEILCESRELRLKMGEIGQKRTYENYRYNIMLTKYRDLYKEVENEWQASVLN